MDVFACQAPGLFLARGAAPEGPKMLVDGVADCGDTINLCLGLVGAREGFARLDKAAACLPVLRRAQCFRGASQPSQAPERSPQRRLGPLHGRFKFKTRFCGA